MITERDLQEAILECQGKRNPTSADCMKLAAFLTIQREMFGGSDNDPVELPPASYAAPEPTDKVSFDSGSEFSDAIRGMDINDVLDVIDELMSVLQTINPRLYNGVMRKLEQ